MGILWYVPWIDTRLCECSGSVSFYVFVFYFIPEVFMPRFGLWPNTQGCYIVPPSSQDLHYRNLYSKSSIQITS